MSMPILCGLCGAFAFVTIAPQVMLLKYRKKASEETLPEHYFIYKKIKLTPRNAEEPIYKRIKWMFSTIKSSSRRAPDIIYEKAPTYRILYELSPSNPASRKAFVGSVKHI
eukprot:TRINITY_DN3477_c0_g1_i2.p3 TRINITY_DN3477_c0_g1~~TRINITY_DN3477_c0_g1_i2.p3  ORF type:complete len:111 (-),score=3.43 TRINITY_DN3477_c0_g1_i2:567-899(-)